MNDAKLSHQFWQDAVSSSNYIYNRIPHKGINNKIPYEILTKNKVNYSNIRIFGCKVFYYIPKKIFVLNLKIMVHLASFLDILTTQQHTKYQTFQTTKLKFQEMQSFSNSLLAIHHSFIAIMILQILHPIIKSGGIIMKTTTIMIILTTITLMITSATITTIYI